MQDQICYNEGVVTAQYLDADQNPFFSEEIGRIDKSSCPDPGKKIDEIVQAHFQEVKDTFKQIQQMGMTLQEGIQERVFKVLRESHVEDKNIEHKKREEELRQKIQKFNRFLEVIELNMKYNHFVRLNVFNPGEKEAEDNSPPEWHPVKISGTKGVIQDCEVSLEATYARLLLINPYSKIPYPSLQDLLERFFEARQSRLEFINGLLAGFCAENNGMLVRNYELYYDGVLVFKIEDNVVHFYNENLFREVCQKPKDQKGMKAVIDEAFVNNAITKGHIPKECESKLKKYIGHTIADAIHLEAGLYGNLKRVQEIHHDEIEALDWLDRVLYDSIYYICDQRNDEPIENARQLLKRSPSTWKKVKKAYKSLSGDEGLTPEEIYMRDEWRIVAANHKEPAWDKLETIFKYLSNHTGTGLTSLVKLSPQTAPELLRIIKMFDWAMAEHNCRKPKKEHFARGSYELRQKLLELRPDFSSFDVFSRTLFPQRLSNIPYLANPKHWFDERIGLQARLIANTHILARSLSERMPTFRMLKGKSDDKGIVGVRGNTASGKSSGLGVKEGILNTDPIKWGLRKGTEVRNKQIHQEGAMLFDEYFKAIEKDPKMKFIVDLRFLNVGDINYYLLEPAKRRECPLMLKDLDVPLLTSLNRVLKRDPKGQDPIPPLEPIVEGFRKIRQNRKEVVDSLIKEEVVKEYQLLHLGTLIAEKKQGKLKVLDPEAFEKCLSTALEEDIEKDLNRLIDEKYIQEALDRGDLKSEERCLLEHWKGMSVREAIEKHANN